MSLVPHIPLSPPFSSPRDLLHHPVTHQKWQYSNPTCVWWGASGTTGSFGLEKTFRSSGSNHNAGDEDF